jgi:hypothetical protein
VDITLLQRVLQTPGRLHLAFSTMAMAVRVGGFADVGVADALKCLMTGSRPAR